MCNEQGEELGNVMEGCEMSGHRLRKNEEAKNKVFGMKQHGIKRH